MIGLQPVPVLTMYKTAPNSRTAGHARRAAARMTCSEHDSADAVLGTLATGYFLCTTCRHPIELGIFDPFSLMPCPHCDALIFVPAKIKSYYLYRPLGGGGMGSVYLAVSSEYPGENLAVKTLVRQHRDNAEYAAELYREAETAALFYDIPGCERAVEYGTADGEYFLAMEYVPGIRLDQLIAIEERLSVADSLDIGLQILAADQAIYDRGYLYRDLKPENIILRPDGRAVLIDFGLCATQAELQNAADDCVVGSPHYLPPERLAGLPEDQRSEIYSLGMLLFHAVSGTTYFSEAEVAELAMKHLFSARLARTAARLPSDVAPCVCRCLDAMVNKRPERRAQTFGEIRNLLREAYREITGHAYDKH